MRPRSSLTPCVPFCRSERPLAFSSSSPVAAPVASFAKPFASSCLPTTAPAASLVRCFAFSLTSSFLFLRRHRYLCSFYLPASNRKQVGYQACGKEKAGATRVEGLGSDRWVEVRFGLRKFEKVLEMSLLVFGHALELVGAPFGPLFVVPG
jgi:hypothetical protein